MTAGVKEPAVSRIRKNIKIDPVTGCWVWQGCLSKGGYGRLCTYGSHGTMQAHRIMYESIHGEIGDRTMFVCHHCDNRACVNPDHLFLGRNEDNMNDMVSKGRASRRPGRANSRSILTLEQAWEIVDKYCAGVRGADLADEYGVSNATIWWLTIRKKHWALDAGRPVVSADR